MFKQPLVSVCMIAFNHEAFICEAIEGVLMQKTNFAVELLIGEDYSTDRTREICMDYQKKHPDKIKLLLNEQNQGATQNFVKTLQACSGKYIAICEGDDFWIDPLKLQKQIDFLEMNDGYSFTSHGYYEFSEYKKKIISTTSIFNKKSKEIGREVQAYTWAHLLTIVFAKKLLKDIPFEKYQNFKDAHLLYHLFKVGKLYYFNFIGGVYRIHAGGIASTLTWEQELVKIYHTALDLSRLNNTSVVRKRFYWIAMHFFVQKYKKPVKKENPFAWSDIWSVSLIEFLVFIFSEKKRSIIYKTTSLIKDIIGKRKSKI